jgi:Tfp pilus assembly protein PilN
MIEINLLPGAKRSKKAAGGGKSIDIGALFAGFSSHFKDKWLGAAIGTGAVAVAVIAFLFVTQRTRQAGLTSKQEKAVADSTRYAAVLLDRMRVQARRDSALLQLSIIKAIDEERYIWPHILEEVSRALPPYTWIQTFAFAGTAQGVTPAASIKTPAPDSGKGPRRPRRDLVIPRDTVRMRMVGRTVDVQAFTRYMRTLEDSPFLENVVLEGSVITSEAGKEVTQFTLGMTFTRPDTLLLRRVPLLQAR